jgi:hypothetical protein
LTDATDMINIAPIAPAMGEKFTGKRKTKNENGD